MSGKADGIEFIVQVHGAGATATDNFIQGTSAESTLQVANSLVQVTASLIPGLPGVFANAVALSMTGVVVEQEKNGNATLSDILGMGGSLAGMLAPLAVAAGIPLAGVTLTVVAAGFAVGGLALTLEEWTKKNKIASATNDSFDRAKGWRAPRDPLMLDLDGDGLELTRAGSNVLFDHDADGVRTGTGWIGGDDGILVRDVNGNGTIDSGRELFGVETIKSDGQKATNGFDALRDLDSNNDGNFTAADFAWSQVRVWRDINQDGISGAGELVTLESLGISRIGVVGAANSGQAGSTVNGNFIAQGATFTQDGATHDIGAVDLASGAVDLESNPFYREFTDTITLTEQAKALPGMQGSGRVRDLQEAVCLSPALASVVQAFASAGTRNAQMSLIDDLLSKWAQSSDYWSSLENTLGSGSPTAVTVNVTGMSADQYRNMIAVLEAFNGERFYEATRQTAGLTRQVVQGQTRFTISPPAAQLALLQQSYDSLKASVYGALLLQTRLKPYLDSVNLVIDDNGVRFDASGMLALLDAKRAADPQTALVDLAELNRYARSALSALGFDGLGILGNWVNELPTDSPLRATLLAMNVLSAGATTGSAKSDMFVGNSAANTFNGGDGDDLIAGGAGNDKLYGGNGADTLDGGAGNDDLHGGSGSNTYLFGRGDGQDILVGATDTTANRLNTLQFKDGISPSDVIVTVSGSSLILRVAGTNDQVTVQYFLYQDNVLNSNNPLQQVRFADGTTWSAQEIVERQLTGSEAGDSIAGTVNAETLTGNGGSDYLYAKGGNDLVFGGAGADILYGDEGNDTLDGGADNDKLYGGNGVDTLEGGAGNDTLDGGSGNNTYLFGRGDGQDTIRSYDNTAGKLNVLQFKEGISPSDIAVRQAYDGSLGGNGLEISIVGTTDKIFIGGYFYGDITNSQYNSVQQIKFADGTVWDAATVYAKIIVSTDGNDYIRGLTSNDSLAGGLGNDNLNGAAGNDTIDGGAGDDSLYGDSGTDTITGGLGNDAIWGGNDADVLYGNEGNDSLRGDAGNDTLDGGSGNDTLDGGAGNNTYLFGPGDGQDLIRLSDSSAGKFGVLQFKSGISPTDIVVKQVGGSYFGGNMLQLSIAGTSDCITIDGFFRGDDPANGYNPVQQVRFADGSTWSITDLVAKLYASTDGNDYIRGLTSNDSLAGGLGNDNLNGAAGNDTIDGGAGDDSLYGDSGTDTITGGLGNDAIWGGNDADVLYGNEGNDSLRGDAGNDTLEGGAGNDILNGGAGNNTYLFGRGDGQDSIQYFSDSTAGKLNTLQLKDGVSPSEIVLKQVYDPSFSGNFALEVSIAGTTDKVTISGFFRVNNPYDSYNPIQRLAFADGTTWDLATIQAKLYEGTPGADGVNGSVASETISGGAGNDILAGRDGNDTLRGGADNDTLYGENGNDTLDGGSGNDTLNGGAGNDTYLFGRGDGQDTYSDYDTNSGNTDVARFAANIASDQLWFKRSGNNLEVSVIGTADKATISNWYSGPTYRIEQFITGDGKVLLDSQVQALVDAMAAFSPPAAGETTLSSTYQSNLNPVLAANWH